MSVLFRKMGSNNDIFALITETQKEIKTLFNNERKNGSEITTDFFQVSIDNTEKCNVQRYSSEHKGLNQEIKRLQQDLTESYDAIINARNKLDSISFQGIGNRIQDLHLPINNDQIEESKHNNAVKKSLHDLEKIMKKHIESCDDDFGGIPELQIFFKVCSQLKHYMDNVLQHTRRFEEIDQKLKTVLYETQSKAERMKSVVGEQNAKQILSYK